MTAPQEDVATFGDCAKTLLVPRGSCTYEDGAERRVGGGEGELALLSLVSVTLVLLSLAALTFVATLWLVLSGRLRWSSAWGRLGVAILAMVFALLVVGHFQLEAAGLNSATARYRLSHLALAAGAGIVAGVFLSADRFLRPRVSAVRQPLVWLFLAASVLVAGGAYRQLTWAISPHEFVPVAIDMHGDLRPVPNVCGYTDQGRRIDFLRYISHLSDGAEAGHAHPLEVGGMLRAGPSDETNCHGWIFTGGRHFVGGGMVDLILKDNGYLEVDAPESGDLVVYRNEQGEILHTALVRGQLDDGQVIVESKFGVGPRYLHFPHDQPYSNRFLYYRTSRGSHLISIRPTRGKNVARPGSDWPARLAEKTG